MPYQAETGKIIVRSGGQADTSSKELVIIPFLKEPEIYGFTPDWGMPDDEFTIYGRYFGFDKSKIKVTVGDSSVKVVSVTPTEIKCKILFSRVPVYDKINVYYDGNYIESEDKFNIRLSPWRFYKVKISYRFYLVHYHWKHNKGVPGDMYDQIIDERTCQFYIDFRNKFDKYFGSDTFSIGNHIRIRQPGIINPMLEFFGDIDPKNNKFTRIKFVQDQLAQQGMYRGSEKTELIVKNVPYVTKRNGTIVARIENEAIMENLNVFYHNIELSSHPPHYMFWKYGPVISTETNSYIQIELLE